MKTKDNADNTLFLHESFVYKWTNIDSGRYYIGKHKGHDEDGYISSGKVFMRAYRCNPTMFDRTILHRGTDKECLRVEGRLIAEARRIHGRDAIYNQTAGVSDIRIIENEIKELLKLNVSPHYPHTADIRILRKLKVKLLITTCTLEP